MQTKISPNTQKNANLQADTLTSLKSLLFNSRVQESIILKTKVELAISMFSFNEEASKKTLREVRSLLGESDLQIRNSVLESYSPSNFSNFGRTKEITYADIQRMAEAKRRGHKP